MHIRRYFFLLLHFNPCSNKRLTVNKTSLLNQTIDNASKHEYILDTTDSFLPSSFTHLGAARNEHDGHCRNRDV